MTYHIKELTLDQQFDRYKLEGTEGMTLADLSKINIFVGANNFREESLSTPTFHESAKGAEWPAEPALVSYAHRRSWTGFVNRTPIPPRRNRCL